MSQRVTLPPGNISILFNGSLPFVEKVNPNSLVYTQVRVGQYATELIVGDLEYTSVASAEELVGLLIKHAGSERTLVMEDVPPSGPVTKSIVLPTGRIGVTCQGHNPTTIINVDPDSPIAEAVKEGQILYRLIIPGKSPLEGKATPAKEFVDALGQNTNVDGRTLVLSEAGPAVPGPPC